MKKYQSKEINNEVWKAFDVFLWHPVSPMNSDISEKTAAGFIFDGIDPLRTSLTSDKTGLHIFSRC